MDSNIEEAVRKARIDALEEAAMAIEPHFTRVKDRAIVDYARRQLAATIRALKEVPNG